MISLDGSIHSARTYLKQMGLTPHIAELYITLDHETQYFIMLPIQNTHGGWDLYSALCHHYGATEGFPRQPYFSLGNSMMLECGLGARLEYQTTKHVFARIVAAAVADDPSTKIKESALHPHALYDLVASDIDMKDFDFLAATAASTLFETIVQHSYCHDYKEYITEGRMMGSASHLLSLWHGTERSKPEHPHQLIESGKVVRHPEFENRGGNYDIDTVRRRIDTARTLRETVLKTALTA